MSNHQQLQDRLKKGFYVDNLYEIASLCKTLAMDTSCPLPFFVLEHLFLNIARDWEERPLPVDEAKLLESRLASPVKDLVVAIEAGASAEEMFNLLNTLVSAYLVSSK